MYFPTTRVLTVLELLQSHHRLSGPELAERLEVDGRTVRRYITMLQDLGIPVEAGRGRYGYYHLRPGFKLPPMMFTDEEALALTLGLLAARKMGLMVAAPAVEGALAKIERVLPLRLQEQVRAVQQALVFDVEPSQTTPRNEFVIVLSAAVQQERCVYLTYRSWGARESSGRSVDPYGLVYRSGFWYLAGYCHLRQDLRVFRLDRLEDVALCDETFIRPVDFDSAAHVAASISKTPGIWEIDVLLKTSLEEAQKRVSPALASLEAVEGGVRFSCYTDQLDWIAYRLIGLDLPLVIHRPSELREAMDRLAERAASLARS